MGAIADFAASVYRDYEVNGLPSSGPHDPVKSEIRSLNARIEQAITSAGTGLHGYQTTAIRDADKSQPDGALGYVFANSGYDSSGAPISDATNTTYQWNKASNNWVAAPGFYGQVSQIVATAIQSAGPSLLTPLAQNLARAAIDNRQNKMLLGNLVSGYLDPAGNMQAASDWRTFTVPVTPGGTVTTNLLFPSNTGVKFLRGDGSTVQVVAGTGATGEGTLSLTGAQIAVPAGAAFMRASARLYRFQSDTSNDQILSPHLVLMEDTVTLPGLFSDFRRYAPVLATDVNPWIGRKVAADGDSYWSGRAWYLQLQADLGLQLTNFSQGGRTMANALKDSSGNPLTAASVAGMDALILSLHTNSMAGGVPVGASTDAPATFDSSGNIATGGTTYFSQARGVIETFAGWNPTMMMLLGTPIYRAGTDLSLVQAYQDAIAKLADMYGCVHAPVHRKCGVNPVTAGTLLADGVHLTEPQFSSRYRSAWRDVFLRNSPETRPDPAASGNGA